MVMDILDTLNHKTYFDEFIIFSGDLDFMPVLLRLRANDRRTTSLAIDFMPPAYKAACDLVISEEEFIEEALGVSQESSSGSNGSFRARLELPVLKEMAQRVFETVRQEGEVAGADLPDILKDFREFRESSNWLGFGTSQRLAEALVYQEPALNLVRLNPAQYRLEVKPAAPEPAVEEPGEGMPVSNPLKDQIVSAVKEVVTAAPRPVLLARASQLVVNKLGSRVLELQWAGAGSFKKLLQAEDGLGLEISSLPEPGYIFDPNRHTPPARKNRRSEEVPSLDRNQDGGGERVKKSVQVRKGDVHPDVQHRPYEDEDLEHGYLVDGEEEGLAENHPCLDEFARRVSQVTGAPMLAPHQYALVFQGIQLELQQIAEGQKTYNTYQSAKAVSDWCISHGQPVSHNDIVLIFKGIIFQDGARFGKQPGSYTVEDLAHLMRENVQSLCERARLELSDYERRLLDDWILDGSVSCDSDEDEQAG